MVNRRVTGYYKPGYVPLVQDVKRGQRSTTVSTLMWKFPDRQVRRSDVPPQFAPLRDTGISMSIIFARPHQEHHTETLPVSPRITATGGTTH